MSENIDKDIFTNELNKIVVNAKTMSILQMKNIVEKLLNKKKDTSIKQKLTKKIDDFRTRTIDLFLADYKEQIKKGVFQTGFEKIDNLMYLTTGGLYTIQALSGHGKTAFMLALLYNFLEHPYNQKKNPICLYITYESSCLLLEGKFLNLLSLKNGGEELIVYDPNNKTEANVEEDYFLFPDPADKKFRIVKEKYNEYIKEERLFLFDKISLEELKKLVSILQERHPNRPIILFTDYFQIIPNDLKSDGWQRMKEMAEYLENLVIEKDCLLFTASQSNEAGDTREGKDLFNFSSGVIIIDNHSHISFQKSKDRKTQDRYIPPIDKKSGYCGYSKKNLELAQHLH